MLNVDFVSHGCVCACVCLCVGGGGGGRHSSEVDYISTEHNVGNYFSLVTVVAGREE
jgi:hypothetical protein